MHLYNTIRYSTYIYLKFMLDKFNTKYYLNINNLTDVRRSAKIAEDGETGHNEQRQNVARSATINQVTRSQVGF